MFEPSSRWPVDEIWSLFVVSLPRSLSSLLYVAAAPRRRPRSTVVDERRRDPQPRPCATAVTGPAPADERFTLLGSAPEAFASMTSSSTAPRRGRVRVQGRRPALRDRRLGGARQLQVLKVRRNVAEVAYTMLKRQWLYPAQAASVVRRASVGARRRARACRGGARGAAGRDGGIRRRRPRGIGARAPRCVASTPTAARAARATSVAASPHADGSRPNGNVRSFSAGSSGSLRRCGNGCATTTRARRSSRALPLGGLGRCRGGADAGRRGEADESVGRRIEPR